MTTRDSYRVLIPDAALILGVLGLYVYFLPEAPHADGVVWTRFLETHRLVVKANYLLMQPIALWFYTMWELAGLPSNANLSQKYLDIFAGICTLVVFSLCLRNLNI